MKEESFMDWIVNPIWKWGISVPAEIAGVAFYFRPDWQSSSPLEWYWYVIIGLFFWGFGTAWEARKKTQETSNDSRVSVTAKSKGQRAGQNLAQTAETIHNQFFSPAEQPIARPSPGPVFNIPSIPRVPIEGITIVRQPTKVGQGNHEWEFKFIVNNDSGINLRGCKVFLGEIASKKSKTKKAEWQVVNGLPSPKSLRWNDDILDDFMLCKFGLDLDAGEKGSFTLADQDPSPRYPASGPTYFVYEPNYTFCDETISAELEKEYDYRLRVAFIPKSVSPIGYHIFLKAHKDGCWDFENLVRITK